MSFENRLLITLVLASVLGAAAISLRQTQARSVSPKWYRLSARDPFFRLLFAPTGVPRRGAWLVPVSAFVLAISAVWVML
jgi:hypothetical protein